MFLPNFQSNLHLPYFKNEHEWINTDKNTYIQWTNINKLNWLCKKVRKFNIHLYNYLTIIWKKILSHISKIVIHKYDCEIDTFIQVFFDEDNLVSSTRTHAIN